MKLRATLIMRCRDKQSIIGRIETSFSDNVWVTTNFGTYSHLHWWGFIATLELGARNSQGRIEFELRDFEAKRPVFKQVAQLNIEEIVAQLKEEEVV